MSCNVVTHCISDILAHLRGAKPQASAHKFRLTIAPAQNQNFIYTRCGIALNDRVDV